MSYCPEIFHKFKKYSEACGLGNPKDFQDHIDICTEISKAFNIEEDRIYLLFSKTASRPLTKFPKTSLIRQDVLKKVADSVKSNKRVTKKHVDFWLYDKGEPIKTESVPITKAAKKVMMAPPTSNNGGVKERVSALIYALSPPQTQILRDAMVQFELDDELAAVSRAIILLKESMKVSE